MTVPLIAGGGVGDIDRGGLVTINLNFKDDLQDKMVVGSASKTTMDKQIQPFLYLKTLL